MDQAISTSSTRSASSSTAALDRLAPYVLSILRIMTALLFLQHGLSKYFGFPQAMDPFPSFSLVWFAAMIELVGGILVTLGLFTRIAAFIMAGQMAVGYFLFHAPIVFSPSSITATRRSSTASCFSTSCSRAPARSASMRCYGKGGAD
jgi:putative oxidoreductase